MLVPFGHEQVCVQAGTKYLPQFHSGQRDGRGLNIWGPKPCKPYKPAWDRIDPWRVSGLEASRLGFLVLGIGLGFCLRVWG